jgi:hypothetical protein
MEAPVCRRPCTQVRKAAQTPVASTHDSLTRIEDQTVHRSEILAVSVGDVRVVVAKIVEGQKL